MRGNHMADTNKIVEQLSGLTVLEIAGLVKQLEEKWGVSAAAPVAAAAIEPTPIRRRSPLSAVTAVQALCNRMKNKLVKPMTQERLLRAT